MATPRKDLDELNSWLKENELDTRSLISLAKEIAMRCIDDGFVSDKVHAAMKEEGGTVEVTERSPAVAISALAFIHKAVEDTKKRLERTPEDKTVIFKVIDKNLEDTL